jgi:hypothetical protein
LTYRIFHPFVVYGDMMRGIGHQSDFLCQHACVENGSDSCVCILPASYSQVYWLMRISPKNHHEVVSMSINSYQCRCSQGRENYFEDFQNRKIAPTRAGNCVEPCSTVWRRRVVLVQEPFIWFGSWTSNFTNSTSKVSESTKTTSPVSRKRGIVTRRTF